MVSFLWTLEPSLYISKCFQIVYILFFSSILFRVVDLFGPSIYIRLRFRVGSELRLYVTKIMIIFIGIVMQAEKTNKQDSIQQTKRGVKMGIRRIHKYEIQTKESEYSVVTVVRCALDAENLSLYTSQSLDFGRQGNICILGNPRRLVDQ